MQTIATVIPNGAFKGIEKYGATFPSNEIVDDTVDNIFG